MAQGKKKKVVAKKTAARTVKKTAKKKTPVKKVMAKKKVQKPAVKAKAKAKAKAVKAAPAKIALKPMPMVKKIDLKKFLSPLDDRLIVQLAERERKTAGGLYIPDTVADASGNVEGLVIAAGRGHRDKKGRLRPMDVGVGDRVIFPQYSGSKIEVEGADVVILRESDVMGLLQK